jgi:predicted permease
MQDFRYALRGLRRQPIFALIAVATIALGIGANTAIFSLVYHVLLRPLPYPDSGRLVFVWNSYPKGGAEPSNVSIPDYLDRRAQAPAIEDAALFAVRPATLSMDQQPEQLVALAVTPSFFSTLRRGPFLGRAFTDDDAKPNADRFVVLTYGLWKTHFASDPSVIGRDIHLNGEQYVVLGVLPADFELPWRSGSLLVPFSFTPAQISDAERGNEFSRMIARLRPGASIGQLNSEMQTIVNRLIDRLPARAAYMRNSGFTGIAIGMRDQLVGDVRTSLYLLQAGVMVMLLIACTNVANLLLMRASGRRRELAIRATLGAGPGRLMRQLLAEGALLSALGAAAGLIVAAAGVRGLLAISADQFPDVSTAFIHPAVLGFTLTIAVMTTIAFGIAPAVSAAGDDRMLALKEDSARGSPGARTGTMRSTLVIMETAFAVVLLVAAGLLLKGFARVSRVDPGFSAERVLTAQISLPSTRYRDAGARRAFWDRLLARARELPGVTAAGLVTRVPFSGNPSSGTYGVSGRTLGPTEKPPHARQDEVTGDYFRAMGIPLIDGRVFNETDGAQSPGVVIVDQYLANRQFPGTSAVGRQLTFGSMRALTIVGVVRTINDADLALPIPEERIYHNAVQFPMNRMALVLKTAVEPTAIVPQVRAAVQGIDPEQAISEVRTIDEWVARSLSGRRTPMTLLTLFGIVALVLCAIGLYGVLAFGVSQRRRELGIRQALGADRASILSLVLTQGLRTACIGLMAGLAGAAIFTRYMQSLLFGVEAHDAGVFGAVTLLLLCVATLACYIPARRATQVDPVVALREV